MRATLSIVSIIFIIWFFTVGEEIHKKNNYKRCISVMQAAVNTGRLARDTDVKKECNSYLK